MSLEIKKFSLYLNFGHPYKRKKKLNYFGFKSDKIGVTQSLTNVLLANSMTYTIFDQFKNPAFIYYTAGCFVSRGRLNKIKQSKFAKVSSQLYKVQNLDELEIQLDLLGV
jgi:hypothetical protein